MGGTDQGQLQTQQQQLHVGRDDTTSVMLTESEFFPDGGSVPRASAFIFLLGPVFCPGGGPTSPLPVNGQSVYIDGRPRLFLCVLSLPELLSSLKLLKTHNSKKHSGCLKAAIWNQIDL